MRSSLARRFPGPRDEAETGSDAERHLALEALLSGASKFMQAPPQGVVLRKDFDLFGSSSNACSSYSPFLVM